MTEPTHPTDPRGKPIALEARVPAPDGRKASPSVARNRDIVRETFLAQVTRTGEVLEIASGTGEHGVHITAAAPDLGWTFTDPDAESRTSQAAWMAQAGHGRLRGPLDLDVTAADWAVLGGQCFDAVFCANMIHIAPFAATEGLIAGAARHLTVGGRLVLYGPFARDGAIAPSNAAFSASLQSRDPSWGVRDLDREIRPLADAGGLSLETVIEMPANNLTVIFRLGDPR